MIISVLFLFLTVPLFVSSWVRFSSMKWAFFVRFGKRTKKEPKEIRAVPPFLLIL